MGEVRWAAFERAKERVLARLNRDMDSRYGTRRTTAEDLDLLKDDTEAQATEDWMTIRKWLDKRLPD